jgi:hypothetical protein
MARNGCADTTGYFVYILKGYLFETGDSHSSDGMLEFISMIKDVHPGIFIHSVYIEEDLAADQRAGFVGAITTRK